MAGQQKIEIIIIAFGTMGMLILALALIAFVVFYQRKRTKLEIQKIQRENEYQRELVNATIEVRENEQKRIALELHDDIGSSLTAIKMTLHKKNLTEEEIANVSERLKGVVKQVREISHDLLPPVLNELGLNGAIRNLCRRLHDQKIIAVKIDIPETTPDFFTKPEELAIYRITQELINNILKHSGANEIEVSVKTKNNAFRLELSDNGIGFEMSDTDLRKSGSLGLKNIASRVQQINASLHYEKRSPRGTKAILIRQL